MRTNSFVSLFSLSFSFPFLSLSLSVTLSLVLSLSLSLPPFCMSSSVGLGEKCLQTNASFHFSCICDICCQQRNKKESTHYNKWWDERNLPTSLFLLSKIGEKAREKKKAIFMTSWKQNWGKYTNPKENGSKFHRTWGPDLEVEWNQRNPPW